MCLNSFFFVYICICIMALSPYSGEIVPPMVLLFPLYSKRTVAADCRTKENRNKTQRNFGNRAIYLHGQTYFHFPANKYDTLPF